MTLLLLYDDERARTFEPFIATRPVGELRAGALIIRERWAAAARASDVAFISAQHLHDFEERGGATSWQTELPAGSIVVNSRCVPAAGATLDDGAVWECGGRIAAVRLGRSLPLAELGRGMPTLDTIAEGPASALQGRWIDEVWELVTTLAAQLDEDVAALGPSLDCMTPEGTTVIGTHAVYIERGARIEPWTVMDVTAGPVLVRAGAEVRAFTRLVGPCYVAGGATVLGDRVHACAIGERSLIRGEISETVVLGFCNKAHDGFVGHTYLGRWVNLGAGTITSNLKNTYGNVSLWTPGGVRDTGAVKLGSLLGDHVKTGIGLRLTTGSVIGAGSNVYGSSMPPKYVPPFSWGEGEKLGRYDLAKFLATTERAMSRRQVPLGERARAQLTAAHRLSGVRA